MSYVLLPLVLALVSAPLVALAGWRLRRAGAASVLLTALTFVALAWGWANGGGVVSVPWAPSWGLTLTFRLDGLAALYALLASGIGLLVVLFSTRYLPHHLEEEGRSPEEGTRFYALILLFMGAMVGLVMAQDLILLFVFWDITAITSYFLIGYDHADPEARASALVALLVTGVTSLLLLVGIFMLEVAYGTFAIGALIEVAEPGPTLTVALALMMVAALAKSAQVPFQFWLPRAMVAPTPVSAYLHSAAMVAAGVFLLQRLYPLIQLSQFLLDALLVIGLVSLAVGGILALTQDVMKRVLAYSTIGQYGYVVALLGFGGAEGAAGASFYVIAHAMMKSALFLTAGAVIVTTGKTRLSELGGQIRKMPWLAAGSGAAAAGLAALPLTVGFFKDELLFEAALHRGSSWGILAALGAGLTVAYIWRFWSGIFTGPPRGAVHERRAALVGPVVVLGALIIAGGLVVEPFARLAEAAGAVTFGAPTPIDPAYHLDLRQANQLALLAFATGILITLSRSLWERGALAAARLGERAGPERWYHSSLGGLDRLSSQAYRRFVPDLSDRIASVLMAAAVLVGAALIATPRTGTYLVGEFEPGRDAPLALALLLAMAAAILTALPRQHLTQVLILSGVNYALAAVFTFFGAPDVALVMVLIATISSIFFLGVLMLVPGVELGRAAGQRGSRGRERRNLVVAVVAGLFMVVVVWSVLSQAPAQESVAFRLAELTPEAHAKDVVTAILADFRGLDTVGEITVVAVALVSVLALLAGRRLGE